MTCDWSKPKCDRKPTEQRQLMWYCKRHARDVDSNRAALIAALIERKEVVLRLTAEQAMWAREASPEAIERKPK